MVSVILHLVNSADDALRLLISTDLMRLWNILGTWLRHNPAARLSLHLRRSVLKPKHNANTNNND